MIYFIYTEHKENKRLLRNLGKEVKRQIEENLFLAYNDTLTNAYKKLKFASDREDAKEKYIIMFNIKNFSKINEIYGFVIGDEVLKITAKRVQSLLQRKLNRINADEFVFFSNDYKRDISLIKKRFETSPIKIIKKDIVNIRILFRFSVTNSNSKDALTELSIAIKEAKHSSYKEYVFYKEAKRDKTFLKINNILYQAIYLDEAKLIPYFQGIYSNKTKSITKYEALARLRSDNETLTPYRFISVAKHSGFLFDITKLIIDKAFSKISKLENEIDISINITEDDLTSNELKNYLLRKCREYNIQSSRVTLEILEDITAGDTKNSMVELNELKKAGFKLAIDDFGVEYSNFERVQELEIDFLKIDAKYIKEIDKNKRSYEIVKNITNFAHDFGIEVVAEFVESEEIQKIVKELVIEYSQGYLFSKPNEEIM